MATAYDRNGVADDTTGSDVPSAFHAPSSSNRQRSSDSQAVQHLKYGKTAAILLGWRPQDCDLGVAPEVSAHIQIIAGIDMLSRS